MVIFARLPPLQLIYSLSRQLLRSIVTVDEPWMTMTNVVVINEGNYYKYVCKDKKKQHLHMLILLCYLLLHCSSFENKNKLKLESISYVLSSFEINHEHSHKNLWYSNTYIHSWLCEYKPAIACMYAYLIVLVVAYWLERVSFC